MSRSVLRSSLPYRAYFETEHYRVDLFIRAAENWHENYTKDPKTFRALIKIESELASRLREYLDRSVPMLLETVDWKDYAEQSVSAAGFRPGSNQTYEDFEDGLYKTFVRSFTESFGLGAQATARAVNLDVDQNALQTKMQEAAFKHAAQLAKGITKSTRDGIASTVDRGVQEGWDQRELSSKLYEFVTGTREDKVRDFDRAEMIAKTESVNTYNKGVLEFGQATGATAKTWQAVPGACPICDFLDGMTVDIDDYFETDDDKIFEPAAHPNCRCSIILVYPQAEQAGFVKFDFGYYRPIAAVV